MQTEVEVATLIAGRRNQTPYSPSSTGPASLNSLGWSESGALAGQFHMLMDLHNFNDDWLRILVYMD